jgi:hypothetical protein
MMREIEGLAAEPGTYRRWFHDEDFDLFVWQTEMGDITLFQLCYGMDEGERALVWHRHAGLFHDGVGYSPNGAGADGAEAGAGPDELPAVDPVIARFEAAAQSLPRMVRRAVSTPIREYLEGRLPAAARRRHFRRELWQNLPAD